MERGRVLRRPHFLSNANTALQFLASKKIKLVNINPADLVDGRPPVVLGLIWTIILYFQVSEKNSNLTFSSNISIPQPFHPQYFLFCYFAYFLLINILCFFIQTTIFAFYLTLEFLSFVLCKFRRINYVKVSRLTLSNF